MCDVTVSRESGWFVHMQRMKDPIRERQRQAGTAEDFRLLIKKEQVYHARRPD